MKANELMIGDWVQNPLGWKARVMSIKHTCVFKDEWEYLFKIGISKDTFQNNLSESELSPIPLTPEILEKNGFSDDYCNDDLCYAQSCGDVIGIHINGKNGCMDEMYFKYVHQLQHALRLCGISKEIEL
jgi:hypothetical protein